MRDNMLQLEFELNCEDLFNYNPNVHDAIFELAADAESLAELAENLHRWMQVQWHTNAPRAIAEMFETMVEIDTRFNPAFMDYGGLAEIVAEWLPEDHPVNG